MLSPRYNESRGGAATSGEPPFHFEGVVMRCFPLKASVDRLQCFVDDFLNVVPDTVAYYRPLAGIVQFVMLNYGRMTSTVRNEGWVAQNEFGFAIPLERYRRKDGKLVFDGLSSVMPYIFVDDQSSQTTGREVYGWPKLEGRLTPRIPNWTRHPRARQELMTLETTLFDEAYSGREDEVRVLVQITQAPLPSFSQLPIQPENLLNPMFSVPRAMANAWQLGVNTWETMARPSLAGYPPDRSERKNAAEVLFGSLDPSARPRWSCANIKQFRDAERPQTACYQSLVEADMTLVSFNGGGLLGDEFVALGDTSGGFQVRLHSYDSLQIATMLGLDVEHEEQDGDAQIATLVPMLPSWVDLNLDYGVGRTLAWRALGTGWRVPSGEKAKGATDGDGESQSAAASAAALTAPLGETPDGGGVPYNTALGTALVTYPGPFEYPDAVVQVLPLLADQAQLNAFCGQYLNDPQLLHRFEASGPYVYLIIQYYPCMRAEVEDIGQWVRRTARFAFPVNCHEQGTAAAGAGLGRLVSVGLCSPFVYYEGQAGTQTAREVQGLPALQATLSDGEGRWMEQSAWTSLMHLSTQVIDALGMGRKARFEPFLEVVRGCLDEEMHPRTLAADQRDWGAQLLGELDRKMTLAVGQADEVVHLKALALEILANKRPLNEFSLKQFRDATHPKDACYQALVRSRTIIDRLHDLQENEELLHVIVHARESAPVVKLLGLKVKHRLDGPGGTRQVLEAHRPFWLRADLRTELSTNLAWRTHEGGWHEESWPVDTYFGGAFGPAVGRSLVERVEAGHGATGRAVAEAAAEALTDLPDLAGLPDLGSWFMNWRKDVANPNVVADNMTQEQAAHAADCVDPQVAIDSILSHEWGHHGDSRLARAARGENVEQKPDHCLRRDSVGEAAAVILPTTPTDSRYSAGDADAAGWYCGHPHPHPHPPTPKAPGPPPPPERA